MGAGSRCGVRNAEYRSSSNDRGMGVHRFSLEDGALGKVAAGAVVRIEGEEARHALKVKRVETGEHVELLDGRGRVGRGVVMETGKEKSAVWVAVRVEGVEVVERVKPRVEVWSAAPKGDRLGQMVDQLAQTGCAAWCELETERGVAEAGSENKRARIERIAAEASKQCGRAWEMEIGEAKTISNAVDAAKKGTVVMADAGGGVWDGGADDVVVLVGPEGGWSEREREALRAGGVRAVRFGPHVMRIETAAVAACAAVMQGKRPN